MSEEEIIALVNAGAGLVGGIIAAITQAVAAGNSAKAGQLYQWFLMQSASLDLAVGQRQAAVAQAKAEADADLARERAEQPKP